MSKTCLLWDFDGTLAYREGMWTASLMNILSRIGNDSADYNIISEAMQPYYPWARHELGHGEYFCDMSWWEYIQKEVVSRGLQAAGINGRENEEIASQFRAEYLKLENWHLFDDTKRTLEKSIELGFDNIILSNHTPELSMLAEHLGISDYFKHIVTSAKVGWEKPNAKFYAILDTFEKYDKYFMIGDNILADVRGALARGYNAILVRKPNTEKYEQYAKSLEGIWNYINRPAD